MNMGYGNKKIESNAIQQSLNKKIIQDQKTGDPLTNISRQAQTDQKNSI